MSSMVIDRITGLGSTVAYKAPCRVIATSNITLSGFQVVSGVTLADGDENLRVLVNGQNDATENGPYLASSGLWERAHDANDNRALVKGTRILVTSGTGRGEYELTTADPIVFDTSSILFARLETAPVYAPRMFGVVGSSNDTVAIQAAITAAATDGVPSMIDQALTFTGTVTVPAGHVVLFSPNGKLSGTGTLTLNGRIEAGAYCIFGTALVFAGTPEQHEFLTPWWIQDFTATDHTADLKRAFAAFGSSRAENSGAKHWYDGCGRTYNLFTTCNVTIISAIAPNRFVIWGHRFNVTGTTVDADDGLAFKGLSLKGGGSYVEINDNTFDGTDQQRAIYIEGAGQARIRRNLINDVKIGIHTADGANTAGCTIEENRIRTVDVAGSIGILIDSTDWRLHRNNVVGFEYPFKTIRSGGILLGNIFGQGTSTTPKMKSAAWFANSGAQGDLRQISSGFNRYDNSDISNIRCDTGMGGLQMVGDIFANSSGDVDSPFIQFVKVGSSDHCEDVSILGCDFHYIGTTYTGTTVDFAAGVVEANFVRFSVRHNNFFGTGVTPYDTGLVAVLGKTHLPNLVHTGNFVPILGGTDATPVITEIYYSQITVPANCAVTGIAVLNGTVASGNFKVGLADSTGAIVATSASTAMVGTNAYQRVPFTATYYAKGPATYYVLQIVDNATARIQTHNGFCDFRTGKKTGQVYATGFTAITPASTFTADIGPIANLY